MSLKIKHEFDDKGYENILKYETDIKFEIKKEPKYMSPMKKVKVEEEVRDPRLVRRLSSCPSNWPKATYSPNICQIKTKQVIHGSTVSSKPPSFDSVLQQIFQWSPEWLVYNRSDIVGVSMIAPYRLKFD